MVALALAMQPARSRAVGAAFLVASAGLPIAAAAAWLGALGALPAAVDAVVTYSAAYVAASAGYGARLGTPAAVGTTLLALYLIIPAIVGAMTIASAPKARRGVILVSLLWIGGSVALFVLQGRFYAHYAIPLAVPAGILAGIGLDRIVGWMRDVRRFGQRVMIVVPLTAALSVSVLASVNSTTMQIAPAADASARARAVSAQLREMPDGSLLVWGKEPWLYDLAGRTPATGYVYLYPLTTPGYTTDGRSTASPRGSPRIHLRWWSMPAPIRPVRPASCRC